MEKTCNVIQGLKPVIMMVTVQIALAGVNVFFKLAANSGMSLPVLVAYRFMFAAATVVPLALIVERKNRPKVTWKIAFQAFVVALFGGSMAQNLYVETLTLTSATFAAAATNLVPSLAFVLAFFFGMESLGLNTMAGNAKVVGTLLCLGGAMLLTFYKGLPINIWSTHFDLLAKTSSPAGHVAAAHLKSAPKFLGPLLALVNCFSIALSLIVQGKMSEIYPCPYSSSALISLMGSLQAVVYAVSVERDWTQWKLGWNLRLVAAAYMGIVGSGLMWAFIMACVRMRGPLFVSVFNPLLLVLVALAGSLLLDERLHLGSVLGAAIIIFGLYSVLWGKNQEMKKMSISVPSKSCSEVNESSIHSSGVGATAPRKRSKSFSYGNNNVMAVSPNFLPQNEILRVSDEEDEGNDLEAYKLPSSQNDST